MRGRFITFEGGEGSGKSTHARILADRLNALGIEVVLTREPGGSAGAEIIRHILLSGIAKPLGAETEAILFAAARDDHVRATILPALVAGRWVICDRFIDSTRVYQGALGKVDAKLIRGLERVTIGATMPNLTFVLDVPANVGLARAKRRRGSSATDRFEAESVEFHEDVAPGLCCVGGQGGQALRRHRRPRAARRRVGSDMGNSARASQSAAARGQGGSAVSDDGGIRHPRETGVLFGHEDAERTLLEAYKGGRIPHAWLIGGPRGIGKATLAYRLARFVLAHPDPRLPAVQQAASLAVAADDPIARRIAAQAQGDFLVMDRVINEQTGKLYTVIRVEDVRKAVPFFGSTAGEGGWRIAIVDRADELQYPQASNALLKILEEPPPRALLLLVSEAPGRLLPTIRSRCRRLELRPLSADNVARALAAAIGRKADDAEVKEAADAAEGSVARAIGLLEGPALALRQRVLGLLAQLPDPDPRALHALGDALGGNEPQTLAAFMDMVNGWLSAQISGGATPARQAARTAEVWEKVNRAARDVETYNLERKPLVFAVFGLLAEAARD